jgi:DNA-binding MarR family transcriptional regulator
MNKQQDELSALPDTSEFIVFSLLGTAHMVEERLEAALAKVDLSLAKAGVLKHLAKAGAPLPLRDLAERHRCVRSNITQLVDRLEKDGLVRRRDDPEDRRSVLAELTPEGERAHAQAMKVMITEQEDIVSSLSPEDAANLKNVLRLLTS